MKLPKSLKNLANEIEKLPGIGQKTAMRLAINLITNKNSNSRSLASAINEAVKNIKYCEICNNLSSEDICDICSDIHRSKSKICIVKDLIDLIAIERASFYDGVYHVLGGVISPLENIDENSISLDKLLGRLDGVDEIIFSLSPSVEADATYLIIKDLIHKKGYNPKFTKVAVGLSMGASVDYADSLTLIRSFENRLED
jgi:recombination protein RecR